METAWRNLELFLVPQGQEREVLVGKHASFSYVPTISPALHREGMFQSCEVQAASPAKARVIVSFLGLESEV